MTLFDFMFPGRALQVYHVYTTNLWDQNILVGHGKRRDIMNEDETDGIDHLMDEVYGWYVCKDGSVVVLLRDKHFDDRAETQYDKEYVAKWDNLKPETRPWKCSCELEGFAR